MKTYHRSSVLTLLAMLSCGSSVWAQTQARSGAQTLSDFAGYVNITPTDAQAQALKSMPKDAPTSWQSVVEAARKLSLPFSERKLTLADLRARGGVVLLHLSKPEALAIVQSLGSRQSLVDEDGHNALIDNAILTQRMTGESLILTSSGQASQMQIDEPVRVVAMTTIGGESEIVEKVAVVNRGKTPLNLEIGRISCGCTGADVSPKIVAPGQTATLMMKMHVEGGGRLVTVNLKSSDPQWPMAIIGLQSVMPKTQIAAPQAVSLNTKKGRAATAFTSLSLPEGVSITGISTRQAFIAARMTDEKAASGTGHRIEIALAANAPAGAFFDQVVLNLKGGDVRQVLVPIGGFVSDDVTAEPGMVLLGNVTSGSTVRKTIIVQGPQDKPFRIQSIGSRSPNIVGKADPTVLASAHAVEISIKVQGIPGALVQDRVKLVLSDKRELDIDIFGSIAKAGEADTSSPDMSTHVAAKLEAGLPAPDFSVTDMNGKVQKLSDLRGKKNLLLTFFPRCFTGGCAEQLASLQDEYAKFLNSDTQVWAVSVDPAEGEKGQRAFAAKLGIAFPLIPDTSRKLSLLYGAAQNATDMASRQSVLIDKAGIVRLIDLDVRVSTHGADILRKIRELGLAK